MWTPHRHPLLTQSLALIFLSLVLFPLNAYILVSSYVLQLLAPFARVHRRKIQTPRRVLVSGVNSAVGLAHARNLYLQGHYVVGADYEEYGLWGSGRFSRSIQRFYPLPGPSEELGAANYIYGLVEVIKDEKINTYISCASATSPAEDALAKSVIEKVTGCRCISFDPETAAQLSSKTAFLDLAKSTGLDVPKIHSVTSRDQIHKFLGPTKRKERCFTLTKDNPGKTRVEVYKKPVLPRRSLSQTYQFISQISVSNDEPYVLEEYDAGEEYCSYVLVVNGAIEALVACSVSQAGHVKGLDIESLLWQAIGQSTERIIKSLSPTLSGPLTIHFRVKTLVTTTGIEKKLIPQICMPKIGLPSLLLDPSVRVYGWRSTIYSQQGYRNVYWVATDLLYLVLFPLWDALRWRKTIGHVRRSWKEFLTHVVFWKEAIFILWDPLPYFWHYSIFWPLRLGLALMYGEKWNVLDVTSNELRYDV
ncbi:MAG: hypothetical protein GOMPHAMPRED_007602 [Gomphillus americanus]|uniref:ATP-grasp domain-containing protein n=1 Tax=Gomphillus americanus TaxID=1940652 RepID=A0A8H3F0M7_9LECA|nr:MAG: hypothetical protein GOMPHAMPRED_007602 [Gomphillus americanus]